MLGRRTTTHKKKARLKRAFLFAGCRSVQQAFLSPVGLGMGAVASRMQAGDADEEGLLN